MFRFSFANRAKTVSIPRKKNVVVKYIKNDKRYVEM